MYNRHVYEFDEVEDLKKYPVWFLDGSHGMPPWTPAYAWKWTNLLRHGHIYGCGEWSIPNTRSSDWREVDHCAYCTATPIPDPVEVEQRTKEFVSKLPEFSKNFDQLWQKTLDEMYGYYNKFKKFDFKSASVYELYKAHREIWQMALRMWEQHFWWMYPLYGAYWMFEDMCKDYVGPEINDNSALFHRVIRGYDNDLLVSDRLLWGLRNRTKELGIDKVFCQNDAKQIEGELEKSEAGQTWLKEFREFLDFWGWRQPRMFEFNTISWIKDPTPPLGHIQQLLMIEGDSFPLDEVRPRLVAEREEAEKEIRSKIPADKKDIFEVCLSLAQRAGAWSETHDFHFEQVCFSIIRRCLLGIGARLVEFGVLSEPDDTLYLIPDEIDKLVALPENFDYRDFVAERRKGWAEAQVKPREGLIGRLSPTEATEYMKAARDPIIAKITIGEYKEPKTELGADLYGNCGCPGVVEGVARVITSLDLVPTLKPDEICVCGAFWSSWTPVLPLLKGIVTDHGGSLAHAAVLGREYDIPTVTNTKQASQKIKTGQRLRVDGNEGVVYILE